MPDNEMRSRGSRRAISGDAPIAEDRHAPGHGHGVERSTHNPFPPERRAKIRKAAAKAEATEGLVLDIRPGDLGFDSEQLNNAAFVSRAANSILPALDYIEALERQVEAARAVIEGVAESIEPYADSEFPKLPHEGSCGPESGCDADCMSFSYMAEHNNAIRRCRAWSCLH